MSIERWRSAERGLVTYYNDDAVDRQLQVSIERIEDDRVN